MLIDTGSSDVIINPGLYKTGPKSTNLHMRFENSYGTTKSDGSGTGSVIGTLYNDTVSFGSLGATQTIGSAKGAAQIPSDGIVGFAGAAVAQFPNGAAPWFHTLCNEGKVASCRFGVALGYNGNGIQVLGELDKSLFEGDLTTTSIVQEWAIFADLAIGGKIIKTDVPVELDTGTATITGPVNDVLSIFNATSIQSVVHNTTDGVTVTGYFPCDKPPTIGFSIPSRANVSTAVNANSGSISHKSAIFDIAPEQWIAADNGNNNCTAVLSGATVPLYPTLWVVGQPFFHGLYIDHNVQDGSMGFAKVRNQSTQNGTQTSTTLSSSATPTNMGISSTQINGFWSFVVFGVAAFMF
ncbi:acid protease [Penicillium riverlandense]|uniref:acid protease n=1 Tax=Penicillium riverlandense TaxID=1903569 RepID=UPI002547DEAD|nr:acid protease [Penicillium riverlandense]KAJ5814798.1 acid protease [Penicillium riverlandense]